MSLKPPQFSPYDFLGYLVPGLAVIGIADFLLAFPIKCFPHDYADITDRYSTISWASVVPLVLIAYFVGHVVSFVSSLTVGRHSLWAYGAADSQLLADKARFKVSMIDRYFDLSGRPTKREVYSGYVLRTIVLLLMLPITALEVIFGEALHLRRHYHRPLEPFQAAAVYSALSDLASKLNIRETDSFDLPMQGPALSEIALHYLTERSPTHAPTIYNYLTLYGFMRSMCLLMVGSVWCGALYLWSAAATHHLPAWSCVACFIVGSLGLAFPTYCAFLKFQYRYNKEILLATVATFAKDRPIVEEPGTNAYWIKVSEDDWHPRSTLTRSSGSSITDEDGSNPTNTVES